MYLRLYQGIARLYLVAVALYSGICLGLLAPGSFAYSAMKIELLVREIVHATWILGVLGIVFALVLDCAPDDLAKLFEGHEPHPNFVITFEGCARRYWSATYLLAWTYLGTSLLQLTNRTVLATIAAVVTHVFIFPIVTGILYASGDEEPERLFWGGLVNDITGFVVLVFLNIPTIRELIRKRSDPLIASSLTQFASADGINMEAVLYPSYV
jgi:Na+-driven multidrug efflux pump